MDGMATAVFGNPSGSRQPFSIVAAPQSAEDALKNDSSRTKQ
jgi:hypothetical protein